MKDLLAPNVNPDGQYGTEALEATGDAAVKVYGLVDAVYLDDRELNTDDIIDGALLGPAVFGAIKTAIEKGRNLGKEVTDLSENEKARLASKYAQYLEDPSFNKIFNGLLQVIDGASELANPANPVG